MAEPDPVPEPESPAPADVQVDVWQRTSMAAERTWLAWWRTALTATAGALAVGRFAPELLKVAPWPYMVLGFGYAALALALLVLGARRQRELERAIVMGCTRRWRSLSWQASRSAARCWWRGPSCSSLRRSDGVRSPCARRAVRSEPAGSSTVVTRHPPAAPQPAVSDHYRAARVIGPVLARIVRLSSSAIAGSIARSGPRRVQQRPANHAT